jgi:hypothetical protein
MIALAVAGGMTLALAATVPWDERWRGFRQRLADTLDPDPHAQQHPRPHRRWDRRQ